MKQTNEILNLNSDIEMAKENQSTKKPQTNPNAKATQAEQTQKD